MKKILLDHGSGGLATQQLISGMFLPRLLNPALSELEDSAVLENRGGRIAFTTDSYVVDPLFFPGGDIGCLAVHGTLNDLAMRGAQPLYLSLGLILEEGLPLEQLDRVVHSIGEASAAAGVQVVAGDTKVVPAGKADKLFINTAGIGMVPDGTDISSERAMPGDVILISGTLADHGITIMSSRSGISLEGGMKSDTMPLHFLVNALIESVKGSLHALRDPTRGGLATCLCEVAHKAGVGMVIKEADIPVRAEVRAACALLGLDPLYLANEGKCAAIVAPDHAERALSVMRSTPEGRDAAVIGKVTEGPAGRVILSTAVGGTRVVEPLSGEPLPRIC